MHEKEALDAKFRQTQWQGDTCAEMGEIGYGNWSVIGFVGLERANVALALVLGYWRLY